jgi:signal transduction histidine kinase
MARARPPSSQRSLRRRAEHRLGAGRARAAVGDAAGDLKRVVHELRVHQVELEMQNEELRRTQAQLAATRDRYASLFSEAPIGYLVLDAAAAILEANEAAYRLLRIPRHRPRPRNLGAIVARDDQAALRAHLKQAAGGTARPLRVTLDGTPLRVVRLETVREPGADADARRVRTAMIDVTEQVLGEQRLRNERLALERSQAALRELTRKLMSLEEDERRRIAADLHDDIGQRLHAVQIELSLLGRQLSGRRELATRMSTVHRHLAQAVADLDGLARSLHPKIVDELGLTVALKAHAEDVARQTGMIVRFRERTGPGTIPANVATCLYRVAQEALRNVHRHAGTREATMTLAPVRSGIGLCVCDRGRGFDPLHARRSARGIGLITMRERVEALHGHLRIRTNPGDGTHVHAWVPLG